MKNCIALLLTISFYSLLNAQTIDCENLSVETKQCFNVLNGTLEQSQKPEQAVMPSKNIKSSTFNCDCSSDFFTVNNTGEIQQWSLNNNAVTGGSIILTGAKRGGLAYCGPDEARTFYCANYPNHELIYYDTLGNNWITIPTPFDALNNGGFRNDQYYMGYTNSLHHYDGTNFSVVAQFNSEQLTVYDIAVDTLGQAWVFTGPSFANTTKLKVYNKNGLVTSYNFTLSTSGAYGAFFIGDQLYLAQSVGSRIVPVNINGTSVTLGADIFFPNSSFADIASCHCLPDPAPPPCQDLSPTMFILPGNISGVSVVSLAVKVTELNNVDTDGFPISVRIPSDPRLAFVWDIGLTSAALIPVQNSDWNYLGDNGFYHGWTYNGPNLVLNAGTTSAFGFRAFYDPQATSGYTTITATIVPFSGGECNIINNVDSEKLVYFN